MFLRQFCEFNRIHAFYRLYFIIEQELTHKFSLQGEIYQPTKSHTNVLIYTVSSLVAGKNFIHVEYTPLSHISAIINLVSEWYIVSLAAVSFLLIKIISAEIRTYVGERRAGRGKCRCKRGSVAEIWNDSYKRSFPPSFILFFFPTCYLRLRKAETFRSYIYHKSQRRKTGGISNRFTEFLQSG